MTKPSLTKEQALIEELREIGFGNQAVIIGTKRVELYDFILSKLALERKKVIQEAIDTFRDLDKEHKDEPMTPKVVIIELMEIRDKHDK